MSPRPRPRPRPRSAPTPPHPARPAAPATAWSDVAPWYDQLVGEAGSEYHREVVLPGVLRLLNLQPGERFLDVACGQGVLCRVIHERKIPGVTITGVDAAAPLIRLARQRSDPALRYLVGDARELGRVLAARHGGTEPRRHEGEGEQRSEERGARSDRNPPPPAGPDALLSPQPATRNSKPETPPFDAAACVLALQNIDNLPAVCAGVAALLRPRGRWVMVLTHPCFRGPRFASWEWDVVGQVQYRRVDRYLLPRKEPIITHPGAAAGSAAGHARAPGPAPGNAPAPGSYTWTFHRPLQAYIKALSHAGLLVDALEEWPSHKHSTSGPRAAAENAARQEIPLFLALRAVRI